jgi:hypothetical protein
MSPVTKSGVQADSSVAHKVMAGIGRLTRPYNWSLMVIVGRR